MPRGVASSRQLAMMTRALDQYCAARGMVDDTEREELAARLLGFFERGARTTDQLLAALDEVDAERRDDLAP